MRVVSLVPSATETLAAWGIDPIACTRFCERPDLMHVGGTKNPDVPAIVALCPDLVVLDRQENRREDADALVGADVPVVVLDVRTVDGLNQELGNLADALNITWTPVALPALVSLGLRAFIPIWRRPWMTIGARTYGSSVLESLGVMNVYADDSADYPQLVLDDAAERAPDVVLVPSEPYRFRAAHVAELAGFAPTIAVDGQDLFWWGARTPDALVRLHAQISAAVASRAR